MISAACAAQSVAAVATLAFLTGGPLACEQVPIAGLGLPAATFASDFTTAQVELGRKLFMDRRLSRNGTMSCGMCHVPEQGFTVNEVATSVGIEGRSLRRNAPSVLNVGYNESLFHDGRARSLEEQVWGPLLAADEMGNADRQSVVARVAALSEYVELFGRAFNDQAISAEHIGTALAAYERSLVSGGSRFDRWYFGRETDALTAQEQRGFALFRGKARCSSCHTVADTYALFTDGEFHNLGVGVPPATQTSEVEVVLAPGVVTRMPASVIQSVSSPVQSDLGRFEVTGDPGDRFAYRTPSLRNVALTAPYLHDGSLTTLREVVDFHDRGGNANANLDPLMLPLHLSEQDKRDLVAF